MYVSKLHRNQQKQKITSHRKTIIVNATIVSMIYVIGRESSMIDGRKCSFGK